MENKDYDIYGVLGLVFGIISVITFNFIFSILGLIFSSICKKQYADFKMAKIGFTLSLVSIIVNICIALIIALFMIFRLLPLPLNLSLFKL